MPPIIEAEGLTKRFGDVQALDGLSLTAESGHVTALLGPNGAGKTTFVSAVSTLLRPDSGTIRVAGVDARENPKRVREIIGLAGQYASVEPAMTGLENLRMVARLFGGDVPFIHDSGTFGIVFSLLVVGVASMNLLLDFDFVQRAVAARAPKQMEWYAAFGLLITLVWLYLEILRLLSYLRN